MGTTEQGITYGYCVSDEELADEQDALTAAQRAELSKLGTTEQGAAGVIAELSEAQRRTLAHHQAFYAKYGNRRVCWWDLDDNTTISARDLDIMVKLGLFTRTFYRHSYGHTDWFITDAGLAVKL